MAHELTHVVQQNHASAIVMTKLVAAPKKMITSKAQSISYSDSNDAELEQRISKRIKKKKINSVSYKGNTNQESKRAIQTAVLFIISSPKVEWLDSEFRVRVQMDDSHVPFEYGMIVVRFDEAGNVESEFAGKSKERKGYITPVNQKKEQIENTYKIKFVNNVLKIKSRE